MSESDDDIIGEEVVHIPPNVLYPGHHGIDPDDTFLRELTEHALGALTPRERAILEKRFGAKPGASIAELEKAAFAKLNGDNQENNS